MGAATPMVSYVGRQAIRHGGQGHGQYRQGERPLASHQIADAAEYQPAERPHQEAGGECPERRDQRHRRIVGTEKAAFR